MIEGLTTIAEKETARRCDCVRAEFDRVTCSIYAFFDQYNHPHLGTGTIVSWGNTHWLITAAHLLDAGRQAPDFFAVTLNSTEPVSLQRRFVRSDPEHDLALCALNPREVDSLGVSAIDGKKFFSFPSASTGRILCTLGWPNTKNTLSKYDRKPISQMIVAGPQKAAVDLHQPSVLDRQYVFQRYYPPDTIDQEGARINAPKLTGLSGGITFDLGDPLDFEVLDRQANFAIHPVGICTMNDPLRRVIRSTRPANFITDILQDNVILEC